MPYITKERRDSIIEYGPKIKTAEIKTAGELNFAITYLLNRYIENKSTSLRYTYINEVIGALECAKLELYRRLASPYEDKKIKENSDVY